ncbi:MAG: hypothetical protein KKI08_12825 [Armatimonadetes bacterium]|nr:hypothetical protein [Armatimonadota bacterium]
MLRREPIVTWRQVLAPLLLIMAAASASLIGCGGGLIVAGVRINSARVVLLTKSPGVSTDDYRWRDIANNLYSAAFAGGFDYATTPRVWVTFDQGTETLQGTINARALKPNFAYQIKLVGKPVLDWGAAGDEAANEGIGRVGRWWSAVRGNVNDAYYEANHASESIAGYLVMGFMLTDENGRADVNWRLENSTHVLWNTRQRAPGANDQPSQARALAFSAWGYDVPYPAVTTETIYPEQEPGRPTPGTARLAAGRYHCIFALYEESFHDARDGAGPGGFWANAMQFDGLDFTVPE